MGIEKIISAEYLSDVPLGGNLHRWLKNFDLQFYRVHGHVDGFADLKGLTDFELVIHFMTTGHLERRSYNRFYYSFIDPEFYRAKYPELQLGNEAEAVRHWMYLGVYEGRVPNEPTQNLIDADIHLFQMGKVASKSIEHTIYASGYTATMPHLHWANEILHTYPDCFFSYDELIRMRGEKRLLFISGVRSPIERVASGLFGSAIEENSSLSVDFLLQLSERPQQEIDYFFRAHIDDILNWFEHKYYTNIDVYEHPFDKERGFQIIEAGNKTVFLYRFDKLAAAWPALCSMTGIDMPLAHINRKDQGANAAAYQRFKAKLLLSDAFKSYVEGSRYYRHFFA